MLADGLDALVEMLVEPNLYARGQVCEIMLSIIDSDQDRFDWFVPFNKEENCNGVRGHLYRKLAGVYTSSLLDKLIANSVNYVGEGAEEGKENSFPGGSARCLQIMVRYLLSSHLVCCLAGLDRFTNIFSSIRVYIGILAKLDASTVYP